MHLCDFPGCEKAFPKLWRLREHQCSAHTGERLYVCEHPGCDKTFIRAYHLKRHSVSHLDTKPEFRCSVSGCERVYSLLQNLRKHERTHTNPLPYKCDIDDCDKAFKKHSQLYMHKARHTRDPRPFKCSHQGCSSSFIWPSELKKHQKAHTGYNCPVKGCDVICHRWSVMRQHVGSHDKSYDCSACGKSFKRRTQLKSHAEVHSESRTILCCEWEGCSRTYTTSYNLAQHVRSFHLGEKPHKCSHQDCSSKYSTKQALKRHIKVKHSSIVQSRQRKSTKRSLSSLLSGYGSKTKKNITNGKDDCSVTLSTQQVEEKESGIDRAKDFKSSKSSLQHIHDQDPVTSILPKQPIHSRNDKDGGCTMSCSALSQTAGVIAEYDTCKLHAPCKFTSEMKLELRRIPIGTREMH